MYWRARSLYLSYPPVSGFPIQNSTPGWPVNAASFLPNVAFNPILVSVEVLNGAAMKFFRFMGKLEALGRLKRRCR